VSILLLNYPPPLKAFGSTPEQIVTVLRERARMGTFDGRETGMPYLLSCTLDDFQTGSRLIYTRDTGHHSSGWFKNPDYERCLHLSVSYREPDTGGRLGQRRHDTARWASLFFGDDLKKAWFEPPHSADGKRCDVLHVRLFCDDNWQPIKPRGEVYSTELTEVGWKSFSELGVDVSSTLYPG
jgi:hypothetical protein